MALKALTTSHCPHYVMYCNKMMALRIIVALFVTQVLLLTCEAADLSVCTGCRCSDRRKIGPCKALFRKWFYSTENGKCQNFSWGGCRENDNLFDTEAACIGNCVSDVGRCEECGCSQQKDEGHRCTACGGDGLEPCKVPVTRYYFNTEYGTCKSLKYLGCGGNDNNFLSREDCQNFCLACHQPKKTGLCKARIIRWYYNGHSSQCEKFTYGGCGGNGNRFSSKEDCENHCVPACQQPKKILPCEAAIDRWYYNRVSSRCEEFKWGGCDANGNNFETEDECKKRCVRRR